MKNIINQINDVGIVPVVVINDSQKALSLATAIQAGGLRVIEVTLRTAEAMESIKKIAKSLPDMLIGAGTVRTIVQVDQAIEAGASFIVSPGFSPEVVTYCIEKNIPVIPGCITPTEIEQAANYGLSVLKFFPAQAAGGVEMLKALASPYGNISFMPTGGININNLEDYLSLKNVIACGGSWMVKDDLLDSENFDKITELTEMAVKKVKEIRLRCSDVSQTGYNNKK